MAMSGAPAFDYQPWAVGDIAVGYSCSAEHHYWVVVKVTPCQVHVRSLRYKLGPTSLAYHSGGQVWWPTDQAEGPVIRGVKRDGYLSVRGTRTVHFDTVAGPDAVPFNIGERYISGNKRRKMNNDATTTTA